MAKTGINFSSTFNSKSTHAFFKAGIQENWSALTSFTKQRIISQPYTQVWDYNSSTNLSQACSYQIQPDGKAYPMQECISISCSITHQPSQTSLVTWRTKKLNFGYGQHAQLINVYLQSTDASGTVYNNKDLISPRAATRWPMSSQPATGVSNEIYYQSIYNVPSPVSPAAFDAQYRLHV